MTSIRDIIGVRFGRLVVIGEYEPGTKNPRTEATVLCKCDCGVERRFVVNNMRSGATTSCGCFRLENSSNMGKLFGRIGGLKQREYPPFESSARDLYQKYMKRNPGSLSFEEFFRLAQLPCHYCAAAPQQVYLNKNATDNEAGKFIYNGLDRLDNTKGYDSDNVITCCGTCNFMRHKLSLDDFYNQVIKIALNRQDEFSKRGLCFFIKRN